MGKRYGTCFPDDSLSITHREYLEAQHQLIPIYSFIDLDVIHDYEFYKQNNNSDKCKYRVVEDTNIFSLIGDIQKASIDNTLISFSSISDILHYLKKQWAGLFKSFLQGEQLKASDQKPKVEIHENFEQFKEKLKIIGIDEITQENVNSSNSFVEMLKTLGGSVDDCGTYYKISINEKMANVGKEAVNILDAELKSIKTV